MGPGLARADLARGLERLWRAGGGPALRGTPPARTAQGAPSEPFRGEAVGASLLLRREEEYVKPAAAAGGRTEVASRAQRFAGLQVRGRQSAI